MKGNGFGDIFFRHLVMAAAWGLIMGLVFFISAVGIKQQVKEGIQYAVKTSANEAMYLVFQGAMPVKQNIKEGVEYAAKAARTEIKALLADPEVKQDLKEVLECGGQKFR